MQTIRCCRRLISMFVILVAVVSFVPITHCYAAEKKRSKFKKSPTVKTQPHKKHVTGLDPLDTPLAESVCKYLGIPYIRGGTGRKGFDCSGLTKQIYSENFGLTLPHNSYQQSKLNIFEEVPLEEEEFEPNDLLFFAYKKKRINHVGIYLSDGKFLHASPKGGVKISNIEDPFWQRTLVASRRVKDGVLARASGTTALEAIDGSDVLEDHEFSMGYGAALDESVYLNLETFYSGRFTMEAPMPALPADFYRPGPTQNAALSLESWQGVRISADIHPAEWLRITPSVGMIDSPTWSEDISRSWQVYGLEAAVSPLASKWSLILSVRSMLNDSYFTVYENSPDTNMGLYFNYRISETMGFSVMGNWESAYLMQEASMEDMLRDVRDVSFNLNFSF